MLKNRQIIEQKRRFRKIFIFPKNDVRTNKYSNEETIRSNPTNFDHDVMLYIHELTWTIDLNIKTQMLRFLDKKKKHKRKILTNSQAGD